MGRGRGPISEAAGCFSRSLLFTGVDGQYGHVEIANAPAVTLGNSFTLEASIRPGLSTSDPTILSKDFHSASWFGSGNSPSRIGFQTNNGTVVRSDSTLVANVWTHVALTFNNGHMRLFSQRRPRRRSH